MADAERVFQRDAPATLPSGTGVLVDSTTGGDKQKIALAYSAAGDATAITADSSGLLVNLGANNDVGINAGTNVVGAVVPYKLHVKMGNVSGTTVFEKFGRNDDVDTTTDPEDVWNGSGLYTGHPTGSAETLEIFSSDANDTVLGSGAQTVTIYNLLDATGAVSADVTLDMDGTTPVSLGATTYYRGGTRVKVRTAGATGWNEGTITVRHTTTTANIFSVMPIAFNQTVVGAYTVPLGQTLYLDRLYAVLSRATGAAGSALVQLRDRPFGGVFNLVTAPEITTSVPYDPDNSIYSFAARTDLIWRVQFVSDSNSIIVAEMGGYLVDD